MKPRVSRDGYFRLSIQEIKELEVRHLFCMADDELLLELREEGIPAAMAGYCDWAADAAPPISIGWYWYRCSMTGELRMVPDYVATNIMLVNGRGYDCGQRRTRLFIQAWISSRLPWKRTLEEKPETQPVPRRSPEAWREEFMSSVMGASSENELFAQVQRLVQELGFDYAAYGIRVPTSLSQPKVVMLNNYSTEWQQRYMEAGYLATDPSVKYCSGSRLPLIWSDELFRETPMLWEEAQAHGLRIGWAQSSQDATGAAGMLTMARGGDEIGLSELLAHEQKMMLLVQLAHEAMARLITPRVAAEVEALSRREREILLWSGDGKTIEDIAILTNLSAGTVKLHRSQAMKKLGAMNITHAVLRAHLLGLLQ